MLTEPTQGGSGMFDTDNYRAVVVPSTSADADWMLRRHGVLQMYSINSMLS